MQPEFWGLFLREFSFLTGVSRAALLFHDISEKDHRLAETLGDSVKESIKPYERLYCEFDEWTLRAAKRVNTSSVLSGEELWPERDMLRSVFYNEFLRKFDVCQMAGIVVPAASDILEAFCIYRGPSEKAIDKDKLDLLRFLAPHLKTAFAARRKLAAAEARASDLGNTLHRSPSALVLIDVKGRPVFVNEAAARILDRSNGLILGSLGLSAQVASDNSRLQTMIGKAIMAGIEKDFAHTTSILIQRFEMSPLQVLAAPFKGSGPNGKTRAAAVVFIADPGQYRNFPANVLCELYGLTKAESRLALGLLNGLSLGEAASLGQVKIETVRTQVKTLFSKTGTKRQSELIRILAALPTDPPWSNRFC